MTPRRFLPALLLLFVGSGCAALIYEVVWFQLLQLVIGSSAVSMAVLLGTFMGGMCLGSYLLPRYVGRAAASAPRLRCTRAGHRRAAVCVIFFGMPLVGGAYGVGAVGHRRHRRPRHRRGYLPAAADAAHGRDAAGDLALGGVDAGRRVVARVLLRRQHRRRRARQPARRLLPAARLRPRRSRPTPRSRVNVTVAGLAILIARCVAGAGGDGRRQERRAARAGAERMGGLHRRSRCRARPRSRREVIWTRLLSLLFGGTVYTFSLILAVFLFGLGIGSSLGSARSARACARPRVALGWCQMFICAAIAWSAYMLTQSMPYWPVNPSITTDPWFNFQLDFVRCLWVVLPGAILWGASFPLALAALARTRPGSARAWSAASTPPTPSARSSDRCARACSSWCGSAASTRSRC